MGLSSNTITHFTSFNSLIGILQSCFKIKYCSETIYGLYKGKGGSFKIAVPIVSFCDIPYSQILNHVGKYGSYGIGLSKKWAEENGLNPVLYLEKHSALTYNYGKTVSELFKEKKISELGVEDKKIMDIIRYMKNYQGDLTRSNGSVVKNYRFSDEREWRYVLPLDSPHRMMGNLKNAPSHQAAQKVKLEFSTKLDSERLLFTPNDINYLIIRYERQRNLILDKIEKIKEFQSDEVLKRLKSRIISVEQIKGDF